ncbi:Methyltransferase domain-containing protein [Mesobacillus persicus]|uniref:Methyltransferase domain-containing protein n=1 Tax=Mesobacillus persicus TaxID=930146 RepID=A0A1H7ZCA6_9BACI|nr:class I SAM-dependent methyltransferase [Mesobacillus persicus]SEM55851.1 Methyltransferase domain-containing protein [Mesobacillus persicus]
MRFGYQDALAYGGVTEAHPGGFSLTKRILKEEGIRPGATVLDAGCGMGLTSAYLASEFNCKVYAVDAHPLMLKHASARVKKEKLPVKVLKGNIENLPFPDDSFDYVVTESATIFTNISNTLAEYFRVLKPSGVLIATELCCEAPLQKDEEEKIKRFYKMGKIPTEKEWYSALAGLGFTNIDVLKSSSILQELQSYQVDFDKEAKTVRLDPAIEEILNEHSLLMMEYAEELGYRVFRCVKK